MNLKMDFDGFFGERTILSMRWVSFEWLLPMTRSWSGTGGASGLLGDGVAHLWGFIRFHHQFGKGQDYVVT